MIRKVIKIILTTLLSLLILLDLVIIVVERDLSISLCAYAIISAFMIDTIWSGRKFISYLILAWWLISFGKNYFIGLMNEDFYQMFNPISIINLVFSIIIVILNNFKINQEVKND